MTYYKRNLPSPPCTAFSSPEGRRLFQEALQAGTADGFFKLMEQFSTQDELAFCGLTSLSMVLNALSIDPRRVWKGAWRWFNEALLDCCKPLDRVKQDGITFTELACLARCNGARVDVHTSGSFSEADFRRQVVSVCSGSEGDAIILSYTRRLLSQTGDGHFSPVGAYHAERDALLILDVARFKYPPHWVPLPLMFKAMASNDAGTGRPRGFLRLGAHPLLDSVLFTLDIRSTCWRDSERFICHQAPAVVAAAAAGGGVSAQQLVGQLVDLLPLHSLNEFLVVRTQQGGQPAGRPPSGPGSPPRSSSAERRQQQEQACCPPLPTGAQQLREEAEEEEGRRAGGVGGGSPRNTERCIPIGARTQLLDELRYLPLFQAVRAHLEKASLQGLQLDPASASPPSPSWPCPAAEFMAEKVTMLLLLPKPVAWAPAEGAGGWRDAGVQAAWAALTDVSGISIVQGEVRYLREQLAQIDSVLESGRLDPECVGGGCDSRLDCAAHGHA